MSLEVWDRHFFPGEHRNITLHVMNDEPVAFEGEVTYGVRDCDGVWLTSGRTGVTAGPSGHQVQVLEFVMPEICGRYECAASLTGGPGSRPLATTRKQAFVLSVPDVPASLRRGRIGVLDLRGEVRAYLDLREVPIIAPDQIDETQPGLLVVVEHTIHDVAFLSHLPAITRFVRRGGSLLLLEPEAGVAESATFSVLEDMDIRIVRRADPDKGGYDSYVFPDEPRHALWEGIEPEHLRMFNGAFGGEAVSQHDITTPVVPRILARCGLRLQVPVVMEWRSGEGRVVVSRLQVRGRLMGDLMPGDMLRSQKRPGCGTVSAEPPCMGHAPEERDRMRMGPMRVVLMVLLVILLTMILTGCGERSQGETEIQFWAFGSEGENVKALLPGFEKSHPGLHVKLQVIPWTAAHEKLLTAYAGESTPDICQLGNTWIPEFVTLKAIEPLGPWISASAGIGSTSYFPGIWKTNFIDSVQYGLPWYVDTRVLFYRKDIWPQAGFAAPPQTWAEWDTLCRRIVTGGSKREHYAILLPTTEWAPPVILGMQNGIADAP